MLTATWKKNDRKATIFIVLFSVIIFIAVSVLGQVTVNVNLGFDPHIFAKANAVINSVVALLLFCGLIAVKTKHYLLHKRIMLTAMFLSILFLISYICHHLFAGEARFGDINHDGIISNEEKAKAGTMRIIYYVILGTHIRLAGIILPFILFSAYRALTGDYVTHKKLVRIT